MTSIILDKNDVLDKANNIFETIKNKGYSEFVNTFYSKIKIQQITDNFFSAVVNRSQYQSLYKETSTFYSLYHYTFSDFVNTNSTFFTKTIRAPKKNIYEKIRLSRATCQYCYTASVNSLDHFFEKHITPELYVFPANLIPICSNCNSKKNKKNVDFIYPYYAFLYQINWLEYHIHLSSSVINNNLFDFSVEVKTDFPQLTDAERDILVNLGKQISFLNVSQISVQANTSFFKRKIVTLSKAKKNGISSRKAKQIHIDEYVFADMVLLDSEKNLSQTAILLSIQNNFDYIWNQL